jgi:hypothetical protein
MKTDKKYLVRYVAIISTIFIGLILSLAGGWLLYSKPCLGSPITSDEEKLREEKAAPRDSQGQAAGNGRESLEVEAGPQKVIIKASGDGQIILGAGLFLVTVGFIASWASSEKSATKDGTTNKHSGFFMRGKSQSEDIDRLNRLQDRVRKGR